MMKNILRIIKDSSDGIAAILKVIYNRKLQKHYDATSEQVEKYHDLELERLAINNSKEKMAILTTILKHSMDINKINQFLKLPPN